MFLILANIKLKNGNIMVNIKIKLYDNKCYLLLNILWNLRQYNRYIHILYIKETDDENERTIFEW